VSPVLARRPEPDNRPGEETLEGIGGGRRTGRRRGSELERCGDRSGCVGAGIAAEGYVGLSSWADADSGEGCRF